MSSPAARAEARRKAILSRGSDRLAKLTTSGRGEDAPAYKHADPPLPKLSSLSNFVGDETPVIPPPPQNFDAPDPSVWSDEQQQQLMQALMMGRMPSNVRPDASASAKEGTPPPMPSLEENPFLAQLMAATGGGDGGAGLGMGMNPMMGMNGPGPTAAVVRKPRTLVQKLLPVVHLVAMWLLLAYFVMFHEPKLHEAVGGLMDEQKDKVMNRWAALVKEVARVQVVVRCLSFPFPIPFSYACDSPSSGL